MTRRVLAIDPGSRITGYAVMEADGPERPTIVEAGVLKRRAGSLLYIHLAVLWRDVAILVRDFGPDRAAVETVFVGRFASASIGLAHARGAILAALLSESPTLHRTEASGVPPTYHPLLSEYAPREIKLAATGSGRADKAHVRRCVRAQYPAIADTGPDDVFDAVAIGLCHFAKLREAAL